MATTISATERFGTQLLVKVEGTRETLEVLLKEVRSKLKANPSRTGIPQLDAIWRAHPEQQRLSLKGRALALIYHMLDRMVVDLEGTVAVVDVTGRFSPSHLSCPRELLQHIHVFQATKSNFQATLASVKHYMEHGEHGSKHRIWIGTIVIGEAGGDICMHWNGWLAVEKEEVARYPPGVSVEDAMLGRGQRREAVAAKGWRVVSDRGEEYRWGGAEVET